MRVEENRAYARFSSKEHLVRVLTFSWLLPLVTSLKPNGVSGKTMTELQWAHLIHSFDMMDTM